jgi:hypothetical protein
LHMPLNLIHCDDGVVVVPLGNVQNAKVTQVMC